MLTPTDRHAVIVEVFFVFFVWELARALRGLLPPGSGTVVLVAQFTGGFLRSRLLPRAGGSANLDAGG